MTATSAARSRALRRSAPSASSARADAFEPRLRVRGTSARDLTLRLDRLEPGRRGGPAGSETRRQRKPGLGGPAGEGADPPLRLAQSLGRTSLLEKTLDAEPRIARDEAALGRRRRASGRRGFEKRRRKRPVPGRVRGERDPGGAGQHATQQAPRPKRLGRRGRGEPLVEAHRAREASGRNPDRSPPLGGRVGCGQGARNHDHLDGLAEGEPRRFERISRNRVPGFGLDGDPHVAPRVARRHQRPEPPRGVGRTVGRRGRDAARFPASARKVRLRRASALFLAGSRALSRRERAHEPFAGRRRRARGSAPAPVRRRRRRAPESHAGSRPPSARPASTTPRAPRVPRRCPGRRRATYARSRPRRATAERPGALPAAPGSDSNRREPRRGRMRACASATTAPRFPRRPRRRRGSRRARAGIRATRRRPRPPRLEAAARPAPASGPVHPRADGRARSGGEREARRRTPRRKTRSRSREAASHARAPRTRATAPGRERWRTSQERRRRAALANNREAFLLSYCRDPERARARVSARRGARDPGRRPDTTWTRTRGPR